MEEPLVMLRVALLSPLYESVPPKFYGGTERVISNLASGLRKKGVDVTVFASGDSEIEGVRIIPVLKKALRLNQPPASDLIAYHFKMLSLVADHAHEFDVIHNHHDYWMLPLSRMSRTPLLTTVHGRLDLPDISEAFLSYPDVQYVSISHSQRTGLPSLKWIRNIYHGLPLERFTFRSEPGKYFAFLGRMCPDKRPDLAIQISKSCGIPLKIAAKIEGKSMRDYYETFIKPHVDHRNIEYLGEISEKEKSDFLGNALALCFPIDWPEPFGLVAIEALACGTPVLARPFGAIPEILQNGVTGYLGTSPEELTLLAQNIHRIDRAACRNWVLERFSLNRMVEDYLHVYREIKNKGE